jgi:hypothetical protein
MTRPFSLPLLVSALPFLVAAAAPGPVTPAELSATVKEIASDAYQGRAPGTPARPRRSPISSGASRRWA